MFGKKIVTINEKGEKVVEKKKVYRKRMAAEHTKREIVKKEAIKKADPTDMCW